MPKAPSRRAKMGYNVDAETLENFIKYVEARHRKPGEVLEEMMRRVVSEGQGGVPAVPAGSTTQVVPAIPQNTQDAFQQAVIDKLESLTKTDMAIADTLRRMAPAPQTTPAITHQNHQTHKPTSPNKPSRLAKLRRRLARKK